MSTILLTATIAPSSKVNNLKVTDIDIRYKQYITNIIKYIMIPEVKNIIFCENSNYTIPDYDMLLQLAKYYNKNLEFLQFVGDVDGVIKYGRGYGEQEILEYANTHSKILSITHHFFKITGRYFVNNLGEIIKSCSLKKLNNFFVVMTPLERRCSTAFFGCSTDFFQKYLAGCGNLINDEKGPMYQIEGVYYTILKQQKNNIRSLPLLPIFIAQTGSGYMLQPNIIKDTVKNICNKLGLYTI